MGKSARTSRAARGSLPAGDPPDRDGDGAVDHLAEIGAKLAELDPAQAALFIQALELTMRKRRAMLMGYLIVLVVIIVGQLAAVVVWAALGPGGFRGWVFLVPIAAAGLVLLTFGRLVRRLQPRPPQASDPSSA
jgi:hypothetical protein